MNGDKPQQPNKRAKAVALGVAARMLVLSTLAVLAAFVAVGAVGWTMYTAGGTSAAARQDRAVLLEPGASVAAMARVFKDEGLIDSGFAFRVFARLTGKERSLKAGEYVIPAGASIRDILVILEEGKSLQHAVTAPEGLTTAQILTIVAADPVLVGELTLAPDEGALLPETYHFVRGTTRDEIVARMADAQAELIADLWPDRGLDLPFSTIAEAVTLASIVEKETAIDDERPRIAAVFVNRMRKGMRLESDPTIIYGLTGGEPLGRGLRRSELNRETPYNTYRIDGLPPTPIANPGREAIESVLNPLATDELFFVARGDGAHVFAKTYDEHRENVANWRRIEQDRNGE